MGNSCGKYRLRYLFILFAVALLPGCSYNLAQWEGRHRDELIKKWGPPIEERVRPAGGKRLVVTYISANLYSSSTCYMVFDTDTQDIVRSTFSIDC